MDKKLAIRIGHRLQKDLRVVLPFLLAVSLHGATYYAAPAGSASCNGSQSCPWDLQTALNKPLLGGDQLLLGGGIYAGNFTSSLNGKGTQIVVEPADPTFLPRINGSLGFFSGGYVTVEGIEFFNSNTNRSLTTEPDCLTLEAPSVNLIHDIIHDCGSDGVGFWSSDPNSTAYGNIIYYNGYNASDRGHGHGIYVQNAAPATKLIQDNVILNQFGWGIQAYTEGGNIDNITLRGNMLSMNGCISTVGCNENIIVDGYVVAHNDVLDSNVAYYPAGGRPTNVDLGFYSGVASAKITSNYIVGGAYSFNLRGSATVTSNYITTPVLDFNTRSFPANTYSAPSLAVVVRPDLYEPGRANVAVLNLAKQAVKSVTVPVAALGYANGSWVMVATAEDYYGAHRSFQVSGGAITLPLTGWTVAAPIGWKAPASTLPAFGMFVLRRSF
ncbi:exported hypothetical protein [Candidatus Sulfopaludibacter sp. SbA4]|nr:exported hypothetical protein [Candidatus Sulfopaludibacter sp. SbA4]